MRTRTLKSAMLAAIILASTPALLALHLNPELSLRREALALCLSLFLPAWAVLTVLLIIVAAILRNLPGWRLPRRSPLPGWPGFTTMALLTSSASAVLYWQNLLQYRDAIPVPAASALLIASVAVTLAAATLLGVCLEVALAPLKGRGPTAALAVLAASLAVTVPLAVRPRPAPPAPPVPVATTPVEPLRRVVLVGMDGLGAEFVDDRLARGELPALAAMVRRGAYGPLTTLRPTEVTPIWTSIVTGHRSREHGVKSFVSYRLRGSEARYELLPRGAFVGLLQQTGLVTAEPVTNVARRRRALWNILNAFGIDVGVVRLPGTHPVERVRGFMLSDSFQPASRARLAESLSPPTLANEVAARITSPEDVDQALLSEFLDVPSEASGDRVPWRRDLVERALSPDLSTLRAGAALRAAVDPPFFATYLFGFDVVGHSFLRYAEPEAFGDVSAEDARRYGRVVDRYAAFLAQAAGDLAAGLKPREVLFVVSAYGMDLVSPSRRLRAALFGGQPISGTHVDAPDGFILALGDGIRAGARFERVSVLDIAPTLLYLMGLPVARDMEGRVATEILDEELARSHAVTYIPSYESLAVTPLVAPEAAADLPPLPEEGP